MSYNITLQCGCSVYVALHPVTRVAHTRVLESRGSECRARKHEVGLRLQLCEMLPDPDYTSRVLALLMTMISSGGRVCARREYRQAARYRSSLKPQTIAVIVRPIVRNRSASPRPAV